MSKYPALDTSRLSGSEPFHGVDEESRISVLDFWQWASSSLAANNLRGHLAEFLVASDLGVANGTREEWASYDVCTLQGYRVEVKSAAYIQQWNQKKLSAVSYGIAPTRGWDSKLQRRAITTQRNSDVFVFCLLATKNQNKFDPTDLSQWQFFVVATAELDSELGAQKTLSLNTLKSLQHTVCDYGEIGTAICKELKIESL